MGIETVTVTGGHGNIGEGTLVECGDHGYHSVNLSRGIREEAVADEYFPDADRRRPLRERAALVSIDEARDRLGWEPTYAWTEL